MALEAGTKLGPYEIQSPLGAGGMGEVYLARDTKLDRAVAVKVLPTTMTSDPERVARFEREAKLLASLNHPNIAAIFGFDAYNGAHYLVMEYVEGESLAEILKRGSLAPDEVRHISTRIAEALQTAHDQGVIHRDLKPGNVMVRSDGAIKVLDFGLAKAMSDDSSSALPVDSPTITANYTRPGVILGTAAYMSPEQARGRPVDKRTDIWSFGVLLYEMLTGVGPFKGETVTDSLGAILHKEIDLEQLPRSTSRSMHTVIRRCLARDKAERFRDMGDIRLSVEDAFLPEADAPSTPTGVPARVRTLPLLGSGVIAGLLLTYALLPSIFSVRQSSVRHSVVSTRSVIPLDDIATGSDAHIAISPDGSMLALTRDFHAESQVYLRELNSMEFRALPDTKGAFGVFFSPDGQYVGYFDGDELRKISVRSGKSIVVCPAHSANSGTWTDDGWIYFTHGESRLARVREDGGVPEVLLDESVFEPSALPDGRGVLATLDLAATATNNKDAATIAVVSPDGTAKHLIRGGYKAVYSPSGHILFIRQNSLYAVPFDADRLEISGQEVSVVSGVQCESVWATAKYALSNNGSLVFVPGGDYARTTPTWISFDGTETALSIPTDVYNTFQISPDFTKIALQVAGATNQIHVYDLSRKTFARLTLEGANSYPAWSADGNEIFFASTRSGTIRMMRMRLDGSSPAEFLLSEEQSKLIKEKFRMPSSVSRDGKYLLFSTFGFLEQGGDVWIYEIDGTSDPKPLIATQSNEIIPEFSPDGKYICYLSNRAGPYNIFVRPFPSVDRREWQISDGEGYDARWSSTKNEIYYRVGMTKLMAVPFTTDPEFTPGTPRLALDTDFHDSAGFSFALSQDGERILVNKPQMSHLDKAPLMLVTNWFEELRQSAPATSGGYSEPK